MLSAADLMRLTSLIAAPVSTTSHRHLVVRVGGGRGPCVPAPCAGAPQVRGAAPGARERVVGELLQHLLTTFASVLTEQLSGLSKAAALQVGSSDGVSVTMISYLCRSVRASRIEDEGAAEGMAVRPVARRVITRFMRPFPALRQLLMELALVKEALEAFLVPPVTGMFATAEDVLAAKFQSAPAAGGPAGARVCASVHWNARSAARGHYLACICSIALLSLSAATRIFGVSWLAV